MRLKGQGSHGPFSPNLSPTGSGTGSVQVTLLSTPASGSRHFGPASSYRRFFQRLRAGVRGGGVWAAVEGGCRHGSQQAGASEAHRESGRRSGRRGSFPPKVHDHAQHDAFARAGLRPRRSHPGGQWATIMRRLVQERLVRILLDEAPPSLLAMRTEFALALPLHPHLDKVARLQ